MKPLAYFITFTTYGSWLHGDKRNSIFKFENGTKLLNSERKLESYQRSNMNHPTVFLDNKKRKIVFNTIIEHCKLKKWRLYAVHVQNNHVHAIINAEQPVDKIMTDIKAWSTKRLRDGGYDLPKVWTQHGSTRYLYNQNSLLQKIRYIIYEQGKMMEYYIDKDLQYLNKKP